MPATEVERKMLSRLAFKMFNNREEEAKRKKKTMKEKLNMPFWWQQLKSAWAKSSHTET